jgi:hypothetical protein
VRNKDEIGVVFDIRELFQHTQELPKLLFEGCCLLRGALTCELEKLSQQNYTEWSGEFFEHLLEILECPSVGDEKIRENEDEVLTGCNFREFFVHPDIEKPEC